MLVRRADGTSARFVVVGVERHPKTDLPVERVFGGDGPPRLAVVTCGGRFDRSLRSYEDNVVVFAEPA